MEPVRRTYFSGQSFTGGTLELVGLADGSFVVVVDGTASNPFLGNHGLQKAVEVYRSYRPEAFGNEGHGVKVSRGCSGSIP